MTRWGTLQDEQLLHDGDVAMLGLLARLKEGAYRFVPPTPATHARIMARPGRGAASDLRDVLGWSLPFARDAIDSEVFALLAAADMLDAEGGLFRSRFRVASLDDDLYLHSAYPTETADAVFFGPDSYRFTDLIKCELSRLSLPERPHVVDIGTGSGVGAIVAAHIVPNGRVAMTDINPAALRLAALNARAAGVQVDALLGCTLSAVEGSIDVILANPPYIVDDAGRDYRDGGGRHGTAVAFDMARLSIPRLSAGGRMILYTGSAIVSGHDRLSDALAALAADHGCRLRYREIDPDIFGEELERPAYADVERIAVVAAIIERPRATEALS